MQSSVKNLNYLEWLCWRNLYIFEKAFTVLLYCITEKEFFLLMSFICARAWQNRQNNLCIQRRLRSALVSTQPDQCLLWALWVAKDPKFLQADSKDWSDWADALADLSLCWADHLICFVVLRLILCSLTSLNIRDVQKESKQDLDVCWCFTELWKFICGASSQFVSSSIPSWQILTGHAQPFRRARDLAFCLKVPLDSLLVWASSGGSGATAQMRRLAWTFAACIGDKYQIRLTRPIYAIDWYLYLRINVP